MIYRKTATNAIQRILDNAFIPDDPDNRDYAEYLRWVAAGNTAENYVAPPPPIPAEITRRQFAQALSESNVITHNAALLYVKNGTIPNLFQVKIDAIANQQNKERAELFLSGTTTFKRNHLFTIMFFKGLMNWTDNQLDTLWTNADAL